VPRFRGEDLTAAGVRLFVAAGVDKKTAAALMHSLVLSNLMGVDSHGIVRVVEYLGALKTGAIQPESRPIIIRENDVVTVLDGRKGFGQIVARHTMRLTIDKAQLKGVGVGSFKNILHVGRLGEFVAMASDEGMIGIMFVNGGRPGGTVAPYGSNRGMLGTNPMAFSIPAGSSPAFLADFATSTVAEGKVRVALNKGEKLPPDCLIDKYGRPTDNPAELYDGGAITTFGSYKGYALSLLIEVLGGILSGGETPIFPGYDGMNNGFAIAIEPGFFRSRPEFETAVNYLFTSVKEAPPALGSKGALIPGEPEAFQKSVREKEGILVDENTLAALKKGAEQLSVTLNLKPV
jgi:LDH2 family malate/lactate/ureidoglycolate dehydrogenase